MKLTEAQRRILQEASDNGSIDAYRQRRRACSMLRRAGLLEKNGLMSHIITDAGKAALKTADRKQGETK
jgi:hypothetical protein